MKHLIKVSLVFALFLVVGCDSNAIEEPVAEKHSGEELFVGLFFGQGIVADKLPEIYRSGMDDYLQSLDASEFMSEEMVEFLEKSELSQEQLAEITSLILNVNTSQEDIDKYREYIQEFRDKIEAEIALIAASHPDFFDEFAADMQSGDHLKVQEALVNATEVHQEALGEIFGIDIEKYLGLYGDDLDVMQIGTGWLVCVVALAITAVAYFMVVNTAVVINGALAVNVAAVLNGVAIEPLGGQGGKSTLAYESQVDLITKRLTLQF